jgi:hypothetical protein
MTGYNSKRQMAQDKVAQPAQEPVMQEKIHALKPMLEALRIKQVVSFSESQNLLVEVANKSGMLPPAFEISGNQWCALVNLAVARFGNNALLVQPSQEPVAKVLLTETLGLPVMQWLDLNRQFDFKGGEYLYTAPQQRPWVRLTEDELFHIGVATGLERAAAHMIESKLKEKNFGSR